MQKGKQMKRKSKRIVALEIAINEIRDLILDLPAGVDFDADLNNASPTDMSSHIGGLIYKICEEIFPLALEEEDKEESNESQRQ